MARQPKKPKKPVLKRGRPPKKVAPKARRQKRIQSVPVPIILPSKQAISKTGIPIPKAAIASPKISSPVTGAASKERPAAAGGKPVVVEKVSARERRPAPLARDEKMLTWGDLKEHIDGMEDEELLGPVEAVLSGDDRKLIVEDVRGRGGEAPVLELVSDDAGPLDDDEDPFADNAEES